MAEPVDRLAFDDAVALGALDGTAFAPSRPRWLDAPGFWDELQAGAHAMSPGFTVCVVDGEGHAIALRLASRRGTPADLVAEYRLANGMTATEVRSVHPGGVFVSEWRFRALKPATVHLVAWTLVPAPDLAPGSVTFGGSLDWSLSAPARRCSLAVQGDTTSWVACPVGDLDVAPRWDATPLPQLWAGERLPSAARAPDRPAELGWCLAVHRRLRVSDAGGAATFALRVSAVGSPPATPAVAAPGATMAGTSRAAWNRALSTIPALACSDPFVEVAWWRRWGGLWQHAAPASGDDWLMSVRESSAGEVRLRTLPSVVRELAWIDPARARALVVHAFAQRGSDGALPARDGHPAGPPLGPVDWGAAIRALDEIAPDDRWVQAVHGPFGDHVGWMLHETEQVMERPGGADRAVLWGVATWRAARWLEDQSERALLPEQAGRWRESSARAGAVVSRALSDVSVLRGTHPSRAPSAIPFVALGTDIPSRDQATALMRALFDPTRFWTPYPVPARALGDTEARWRAAETLGNGDEPDAARVVPWLTCAIIDALLEQSAETPPLREEIAHLLGRFVRMHFDNGDLRRPVAATDFNPLTGEASSARGARGDQRTWLGDLLIRLAAGVRPHAGGITIDPLPMGLERLELGALRVRGRTIEVVVDASRVVVIVDGARLEAPFGTAIEIDDER